ncbi:replication initiator [Kitasatospora sp. NPDC058032]|uniref:replication initiator n=1 Tax=Kitasatospora sp. NPDC058032 TaxID=3346307 RepID=UPI0036D96145
MNSGLLGDPSARLAYLGLDERLRALNEVDRDLVRLGQMPGLSRWLEQVAATGGCARPVYLRGMSETFDVVSGELVRRYSTEGEPGERLALRCRNRRSSRCGPCSWLHQGDSWHLVHAGLAGGKGVPAEVRSHPTVFLTLTAPSFGRVHRAGRCHPQRPGLCAHGQALGCGRVHPENGALVGGPLCVECYDYPGHVLWNVHAGALWKAFTDNVYHHLAALAGVGRSAVRRLVRVSAVKVAEYQRRGVVHFHAVVRLDGPAGPADWPPSWATAGVLVEAVRTAVGAVALTAPASAAYGERRLRFGVQVDVHELRGEVDSPETGERVAAYVAKYTTKGAEAAGAVDRRVTSAAEIRLLRVSAHMRALVGACWRLGGLPELAHLRLRAWAHMLGFRGHCLTKTRSYSTTYRSLRAERGDYVRGAPAPEGEVTVGSWRFAGTGHRPGEALIAEQIAADLERTREITRDHLPPGWVGGARREPPGADTAGHTGVDHGG